MTSASRRDFLLALGGAALLTRPGAVPLASAAAPLRFGLTPVVLDDQAGFLTAWAQWLSVRLGRPLTFVQRSRYREILDLLLSGRLDLAWICGFPYIRHRHQLPLIVVPRFRGRPLYQSHLIVAKDALVQTWRDLEGRLFAWADPDSNSGYLYPRHLLTQAGKDPDHFFRRTFFTWGHPRSIEAVAVGLADGAAVDSYVLETLAQRQPALVDRVRVIARSPDFGFPPIVASPALPESDREALRRVLIDQVQDAEGQALLRALNLDNFSLENPALYDGIAEMAAQGRGEVKA